MSTKIHQIVDGRGLPIITELTAGQDGDCPMLIPLLEEIRIGRRSRPNELRADKAYASRANRDYLRKRRVTTTIPEPLDRIGNRKRKGSKGGRPPKFDAESYKGRNVVERRFCGLKQWRGLATRYDKHALVYRAGVLLHGIVTWLRHLTNTP